MKFLGASGRVYVAELRTRGGGQADVFPAEDDQGRRVAIKQARRPLPASAWLQRERDHLRELHEANPDLDGVVIRLLDHGLSREERGGFVEETPFLVLPWYAYNLEDWLKRERRPLARRLRALSLAARAVARLHWTDQDVRKGVVHRDVKPSNFLLDEAAEGPRVVLADFGSARRGHLEQPSTLTGAAAFTAAFSPPEQTLPRRVQLDRSWDVFALGVTLYWGLVGHLPESVQEAASPWTRGGQRLATLENRQRDGRRLSPEEAAELDRLKDAPLHELIDVRGRPALTEADRTRITEVFTEELGGTHLAGEASGLAEGLIRALEHALRPDPSERQSDARPLMLAVEAACAVAHRPPPMTFSWLHLSGLNAGAPGFEVRWPVYEEALFEDLTRLHAIMGPWDAVLVSGGLTWSGSAEQRAAAAAILERLNAHLRALGSEAAFLAVPGEGDLERPADPESATIELLAEWETRPKVQRRFWEDPSSEYRRAVAAASEGFADWWRGLRVHKAGGDIVSVLPGDFAATLTKKGPERELRVGVIGLNSAAFALRPGAPVGGMVVGVEQLQGVTGGDGARWTARHALNLLLTRHGPDQLSPSSRAALDGEIAPPGRFGVHLSGGADGARATALGGAPARLTWSAPALFPVDREKEAPGYHAGQATFGDDGVSLRLWPRAAVRKSAGHRVFGPDGRYSVDEVDQGGAAQAVRGGKGKAPVRMPRGKEELVPPPRPLRVATPGPDKAGLAERKKKSPGTPSVEGARERPRERSFSEPSAGEGSQLSPLLEEGFFAQGSVSGDGAVLWSPVPGVRRGRVRDEVGPIARGGLTARNGRGSEPARDRATNTEEPSAPAGAELREAVLGLAQRPTDADGGLREEARSAVDGMSRWLLPPIILGALLLSVLYLLMSLVPLTPMQAPGLGSTEVAAPSTPVQASGGGPTGNTYSTTAIPDAPMTFIGLSGGTFLSGSPEGTGSANERPQQAVTVSPFAIGQSEVTWAQWDAVVKAAKSAEDAETIRLETSPARSLGQLQTPMDWVSWCDAVRFANALSRLEGKRPGYSVAAECESGGLVTWNRWADGYRLPTEAEWEYAARAGTTTRFTTGDTEADLASAAWYGRNSGGRSHDVCTAKAKPWGLCDMLGNGLEWTWDWYAEKPYVESSNPSGPSVGEYKVLRGGSWWDKSLDQVTVTYRFARPPKGSDEPKGLRLVLPVTAEGELELPAQADAPGFGG